MQKSFARALDINRLKDWGIQAAKALFDFGMQCVNAASDLQEVQNVVDTTFGESANQIDAWAKTAITQFGLSETKAKQFASTLGAMMKSAGMAGDEVVKVSEDLAGLAADMSSFYNLDFDTAFQKIRSGISGETEPLKQLGINMSQANLQAFALEKGITKALDKMSQGEMVMLRYQYLMQATADAQGDFARTSDGYANSMRLLESNLESIKTKVGTVFINILADATTSLNNFLSLLTKEKPRTVLDDFADIDLKTEEKLTEIRKTSGEANTLISTLESISAKVIDYKKSGNLVSFINDLSGNVTGLDGAIRKAQEGNLTGSIDELATALSKELGGDPDKWKNLLSAISDNAAGAIEATKGDTGKTKAFLESVAEGADDLTTDYSPYWNNLLGVLGDKAEGAFTALGDANPNTGKVLSEVASGANSLGITAGLKWQPFIDAIGGLTNGEVPTNLKGVADALATKIGGDPKKWEDLLKAIGENAGAAIEATKGDSNKTQEFLEHVAAGAADLNADYSPYWEELLVALGDNAEDAINALADEGDAGDTLSSIAEGAKEISEIPPQNDPGKILESIATGANKLSAFSPAIWISLFGALKQVNGLENIFSDTNAGKNVEDLAKALSNESPDVTKAEAWKTFLGALSEHPDALTTLTQTSAEETAAWLSTMAAAVNEIEPGDADSWSNLFTYFVNGLPGLNDTEGGHAFFQTIAQEFLAMGSQSETARQGLMALGLSSDQVDEAQSEWLETCKRLVQTLPGLNSIINTQTGEVSGGTEAVRQYVKEWEEAQRALIIIDSISQKERALIMKFDQIPALKVDVREAQTRVSELRKSLENLYPSMQFDKDGTILDEGTWNYGDIKEYIEALDDLQGKKEELDRQESAYETAEDRLKKEKEAAQELVDKFGDLTKSANEAGTATSNVFTPEVAEAARKAVDETEKAVKALQDYTDQAYKSSLRSVEGTLGGFNRILTPMDEAKQKVQDLTKQLDEFEGTGDAKKDGEERNRLSILLRDAKNAVPTIQNLSEALDTQIKFLDDYYKSLDTMRKLGYSEEVIAMVSGGTAQDAANAMALADTRKGDKNIEKINKQVESIQTKSKKLASAMTENKLAIDQEYKDLTQGVSDAIAGLDQYTEAKENINKTMQGILEGLGENANEVQTQVQHILDMLAQLSGASYNVNIPGFNMNIGTSGPVNPIFNVHSTLNVDGKRLASSVSEHQAEQLNQLQRSGNTP